MTGMDAERKFSGMIKDDGDERNIFIHFLRSRLYVINTSLYLLGEYLDNSDQVGKKYIKKINEELETIRKFINMG